MTADKRLYEFGTFAAGVRIQTELLRMTKSVRRYRNAARIAVAPTQTEIANRVGTCREVVSRELNRLARLGIIERERTALVIKDVNRLAAMVEAATGEEAGTI